MMGIKKFSCFLILLPSAVFLQPVYGVNHIMQIEQVIGGVNGDVTAQAIQLRMRAFLQNFIAGTKIVVRDEAGANPVTLVTFGSNVVGGTCSSNPMNSRILVASANFVNNTNPAASPDFTLTNLIPESYLAAGSLTFEAGIGTVWWRVSWGGAGYTGGTSGSIFNDGDGDFGPPFAGPLPSNSTQALQFQATPCGSSTTNLADYGLTPSAAIFTNNNGQSFTVGPPPPTGACCDDLIGMCINTVTEEDCLNLGNRYGGDDTTCLTIDPPCSGPALTGACCNEATGLCTDDFMQDDCENLRRHYGGNGSTCETLEPACVQPTEPPIPIGLELVAEGLTSPVFLTHAGDGSGRLFIVDQIGQIRVVKGGSLLPTPYLDLTDRMIEVNPNFDERGLLGLAFHPDYSTNGRFFVRYSKPRTGVKGEPCFGSSRGCHEAILSEFSVMGDPATSDLGDPTTENILFRVDEPQFNHNSGQVAFGPDGLLYWTLGDGGGANDGLADVPPSHGAIGNGQNPLTALGNILRIDMDSTPDIGLPYAIPTGNPFADGVDGLPEIYAYGLRNPYRFSFDSRPGGDGSLYLTDVGQALFEEVNVLSVLDTPPLLNMGWVIREGLNCFDPLNQGEPPAKCTNIGPFGETMIDPVLEYTHSIGIAIIGGYVYRGSAYPPLQGKYVFGDWLTLLTGSFFYSDLTGPDAFVRQQFFIAPEGDPLSIFLLGLGEDEDGELYALTTINVGPTGNDGEVFKIVPPAPRVEPAGSRYVAVTVPPGQSPMALVVRRGCGGETPRYIDIPTGPQNVAFTVVDPVNGAFLSSNGWGTVVNVMGLDITSDTDYEVQIDYGTTGSPALSSTAFTRTYKYGNSTDTMGGLPDETTNIADVLMTVGGWLGDFSRVPLLRMDTKSLLTCVPDQDVNIVDVLEVVATWLGTPDPCAVTCP